MALFQVSGLLKFTRNDERLRSSADQHWSTLIHRTSGISFPVSDGVSDTETIRGKMTSAWKMMEHLEDAGNDSIFMAILWLFDSSTSFLQRVALCLGFCISSGSCQLSFLVAQWCFLIWTMELNII